MWTDRSLCVHIIPTALEIDRCPVSGPKGANPFGIVNQPVPGVTAVVDYRAEASFRDAIALAERQSAKLFQLRASTSLARLWRDQGRRVEARDLLGPIYRWFTEDFDAPDMKDAKARWMSLA